MPRERATEGGMTEGGDAGPVVNAAHASARPPADGQPGVFTLPRARTRTELARFLAGAAVDGVRHRKDFKEVEKVFFLIGYPRSRQHLDRLAPQRPPGDGHCPRVRPLPLRQAGSDTQPALRDPPRAATASSPPSVDASTGSTTPCPARRKASTTACG